jgi:tight adherence protein B
MRTPAHAPCLNICTLRADAATIGLPHALEGFARRLADPLADVLAATLALNHRLGGRNLSAVLDDLAAAIHAEAHTLREVRARQAQQRLSARLVAAAPLVILVAIRQTNPAYLAPFDTAGGQAVLAVALGLIVIGYGAMVCLARPPAGTRLLPTHPAPGGGRP